MASSLDLINRRSARSMGMVAERTADVAAAERGWRRMAVLLAALGDPQLRYPAVHIAGSKGKGTTAYFTAALLESAGLCTGRYVSPHLLRWNERIAVNGESISDQDFDRALTQVDHEISRIELEQPAHGTFNAFELLTAAAFLHFRNQRCDAAVIEVGLGGRFDSTNHLDPTVTVITRTELEHADILGPRLADIAWNKAGIIRPGVPVIAIAQDPIVLAAIEAEANAATAPVWLEDRDWFADLDGGMVQVKSPDGSRCRLRPPLPGLHNRSNLGAAVVAARTLIGPRFDLAAGPESLQRLRIPGRFDRRHDPRTGRNLIIDGAHTAESIAALLVTAAQATGINRFPVVLGLLADKPAGEILGAIAPHASVITFPNSASPRAASPGTLLELAQQMGIPATTHDSLRDAIDSLPTGPEPILVTGSFSMVAETLRMLGAGI